MLVYMHMHPQRLHRRTHSYAGVQVHVHMPAPADAHAHVRVGKKATIHRDRAYTGAGGRMAQGLKIVRVGAWEHYTATARIAQ